MIAIAVDGGSRTRMLGCCRSDARWVASDAELTERDDMAHALRPR
jgi:hypothetical protein